jgi:hypothetical protein
MGSLCCLCVSSLINCWMPEPVFMKTGMYVMAPQRISRAYFINPSHDSACLYVYSLTVARQRPGKNVTPATNTRYNIRNFGHVVFCAVRVLSKVSRRLFLPKILFDVLLCHSNRAPNEDASGVLPLQLARLRSSWWQGTRRRFMRRSSRILRW